jgi:hypothetical protein
MSGKRAVKDAIDKIQNWTMKSKGRINTLLSSTVAPGGRAVPTKTVKNDTEIGARVDNGQVYERDGQLVKSIYLQPNENASNKTLKKLADQDSHQNLSWTEVPIDLEADEKKKKKMADKVFEDLRKNAK